MTIPTITRRSFLRTAGVASAGSLAFPAILRSAHGDMLNNKLNIACIGVGGRGRMGAVAEAETENRVAFCDVDDASAAATYKKYPSVPRFRDYRKMFDELGKGIDAVAISTPDHMHFPIAMTALALGKHVFCEKPLAHTVEEARRIRAFAAQQKVATQMGNQGHAGEPIRIIKEWIDAGLLGDVTEVHSWTNRPGHVWPQGTTASKPVDHSKFIPVVPPTLDWDLWQGVAQPTAYDPAYLPGKWRGFWEYGTGALGDMGCHLLDGAHWALRLDAPKRFAAIGALHNDVTGPAACMVTFEFPARGTLVPLVLKWYEGGLRPPIRGFFDSGRDFPDNGTLFIGSKAIAFATSHFRSVTILPSSKMLELKPSLPPKTIPRIKGGYFAEWIRACKGGPAAGSNFDVAARLTELCLLSNVAVRAQRPLEWDAAAMKVTNFPEANQYLAKQYRPGFGA
jgi:predicted dehydrogenase